MLFPKPEANCATRELPTDFPDYTDSFKGHRKYLRWTMKQASSGFVSTFISSPHSSDSCAPYHNARLLHTGCDPGLR